MTDRDVIVIGAGHNGLVAAAYLAAAGLDVLVVEARDGVGGCASTVDAIGARVNVCMCDHVLIRSTPIIEELRLADHGLDYVDLEPHHLHLGWDGADPWFGFTDLDRTLESLGLTHPAAVDGYRRLMRSALPAARMVLDLANATPTPGAAAAAVRRQRGRGPASILRWSRASAREILERHIADPEVVGALLADAPTTWGVGPDTARTGLAVLSAAIRHLVVPGRPIGGSGALPAALAAAVAAAGGTVRCSAPVERVLVEAGSVRGVTLRSREEITAPTVVAAADPRRLYTHWLDGDVPTPGWVGTTPPDGYESKLDVVLDRLPTYRGVDAARHGVEQPLVPTATVSPGPAGLARAHAAMLEGRVGERPVMYLNWPSVTDGGLSAPGEHLLGLEVLFTPYRLQGGWGGGDEPERWLRLVSERFQPGFLDSVKRWRLVGPTTYESDFGLERGFVPGYAGGPVQALVGRPRELTRYSTAIEGLWVTGGGTFPGAGIWGAPGRNAASRILESI